MKKALRISGLIGITLLYCFATSYGSFLSLRGDAIFHKESGKDRYSQSVSPKSFQHTVQTENAITVCSNPGLPFAKDTHKDYLFANIATGHVLVRSFSQYHFFANKLLTRLQNPDLVFPFQYFW